MNAAVSRLRPFDAYTAICRSVLSVILTLHLLLLLVLSRSSPRDYQAFSALCLIWPVLVPFAFALNIAALYHIARSTGGGASRRVCLALALVSLIGTGVCGTFVFIVVSALGTRGIELH